MTEKLPGDTWLWRLAKRFLTKSFIKKYNLCVQGVDKIPKPPFLIIGNHTHFLDPLFINAILDYPIVWVAARGTFQAWWAGPILKASGAIAKQKGVPDMNTIRQIYATLRKSGIVGIFPEGSVTWNGNFGELPKGTNKLLEKVKVPILAAKIHGGYLSKPRWADYARKGKIEIELAIFEDERAIDFISDSEWDWQEKKKIKFIGKNKAEGIERVIWFCPKCQTFKSIKAKGDKAKCTKCGYELIVDEYGYVNNSRLDFLMAEQERILYPNYALRRKRET
ncbi:1-acyl-sn-glycerol-3-phosphate acyltransferase [Kosmotoga sp.]|uniref:lysophospholipid acyltransferase family protein n=2 Tax=Kosmotogaceae TaxID=1643948 RepID=UPI0024ABF2B1|nr:1-acyl-sn-glycerol-3-phosphate acyltransferase [Kosmotoga sp.]MDI3524211.1 hypothetical protein [Kosmotoga sp.]